jgi:hypothetical protein
MLYTQPVGQSRMATCLGAGGSGLRSATVFIHIQKEPWGPWLPEANRVHAPAVFTRGSWLWV